MSKYINRGMVAAVVMAGVALIPLVASANGFVVPIFDPILDNVNETTTPFLTNSIGLAGVLFKIILAASVAIAAARYAVVNQTLEGSGHFLMNMFITVVCLDVVIEQAPTVLSHCVEYAQSIAGTIAPGIGTALRPDEIIEQGWLFCGKIIHNSTESLTGFSFMDMLGSSGHILSELCGLLIAILCCPFIMAAFGMIAFQLFIATIQTYFCVSIGAISLGWIAGSGTKAMADAYLGACWKSVMHLVTTLVSVGFVMGLVGPLDALTKNGDPHIMMANSFKLATACIIGGMIAWKLPGYAESMFSGSPAISGLEAMAGAASGMKGTGAAAKGAVAGGAALGKGLQQLNKIAQKMGL
jgi:hypothetical protein